MSAHFKLVWAIVAAAVISFPGSGASAQVPPSTQEIANYSGLHKAAVSGDLTAIHELLASGADPDPRDGYARTPLHVAAYRGQHDALRALTGSGADPNALERDFYDVVTIAAVADDVGTLSVALEIGCSPGNVTSRYDGTALIAAAHLGHWKWWTSSLPRERRWTT